MKRVVSVQRCATVVLVLAMVPTLAQAYIDPGSGAYMVQALFALVGAVMLYARHPVRSLQAFGRWITSRWRKGDPSSVSDTDLGGDIGPSPAMHEAGANSDEAR
jgi:hypothetical protein